jgi:hypothetical protein
MLRTGAKRVALGLALVTALFVAAVLASARPGDRALWPPKPGVPTIEVFVVSHGYHAGIVVPRRALADAASRRGQSALGYLATRFADFDRLEIGWGDEGFYRHVPAARSLTMALALRALFRPGNPSVVHVVGVGADPRALLDAAGVPTTPVLATLPYGLLLDLEWRSGLARLAPSAPKP